MASSQVELVNSALIKLGETPIMSLDDAVKSATLAKNRFVPDLRYCLRTHVWNFALERQVISPLETAPPHGWTYRFNFPSDLIRLIDVDSGDIEYRVERRGIVSNSNTLELLYIREELDPTLYDSMFDEMFACYLAWDLAYALTQSMTIKNNCWEAYREQLRQARSVNAKEEIHDQMESNYWDEARVSSSMSRSNR